MRIPFDPHVARRAGGDREQALTAEIAQEKAVSLGRAGQRLDDALALLRSLEPGADNSAALAEAGEALFFYVVQREACGLYDSEALLDELDIPRRIWLHMGLKGRVRPPRDPSIPSAR